MEESPLARWAAAWPIALPVLPRGVGRQPFAELSVVGLLDKPSPSSMGMVPLVVASADGQLLVTGLANRVRQTLAPDQLESLVAEGRAMRVDLRVQVDHPGPFVGAWLGRGFLERARSIGAPMPDQDGRGFLSVEEHGLIAVESPATAFAALVRWLRTAFARAIERRSEELAELMIEVLPDRDETRAALWLTAEDAGKREAELRWWLRLERDAGREANEEGLLQRMFDCQEELWMPRLRRPSLEVAGLTPRACAAIGVACAQRLLPLLHWPEGAEGPRLSASDILGAARDATLGRSIALRDHEESERLRHGTLEIALAWEPLEPSTWARGHSYPAIHALESALFAARAALTNPKEAARDADQACHSVTEGIVLATYPEDHWRFGAFLKHADELAARSVLADIEWLRSRERVTPLFYERDAWPGGKPLGWDETIERHQSRVERLFEERRHAQADLREIWGESSRGV